MINLILVVFALNASEECSPCNSTNWQYGGQVGNYQVNNLHYEVIVHYFNMSDDTKQFIINGEQTELLNPGESFTLHDGSTFTSCPTNSNSAIFCINGNAGEEIIESCDQSFCMDEDGQNTFLRGHQLSCYAGRIYEYYDMCWNSFELSERVCSPGSSYYGAYNVQCSNGCLDGRCIECVRDADCDDGVRCSSDVCDETSGTCTNDPIPGCCSFDGECDDGIQCTEDTCVNNACQHDDSSCRIPTMSEWGLVVMSLLLLIVSHLYFGRKRIAS